MTNGQQSAAQAQLEGLVLFATPSAPDPAEAAPVPNTQGGQLAAARLRKGISLQQVSEHLRLSIEAIEALEADLHDDLGPQVYVRGHLRRYADFLGETLAQPHDAAADLSHDHELGGQRSFMSPLVRVRTGRGPQLSLQRALLIAVAVLAVLITVGLLAQPALS
jgi:cytoskeleton protein RodZ